MMNNLKQKFRSLDYISITTDGWKGANHAYLGYTASWLNDDLEREYAAIALRRIFGRQTFDVLGKHIMDILAEFEIQNKTAGCTTDSASNYKKSFIQYAEYYEGCIEEKPETDEDEEIEIQIGNENENDTEENVELEMIDIGSELETPEDECADCIALPDHYRCSSHKLNNIGKTDIQEAKKNPTYHRSVVSGQQKLAQIRNKQTGSTQKADEIKKVCGSLFIIPGDTRWNGEYQSYNTYIQYYGLKFS